MNIDTIPAALLTVGVPVSHYTASKQPDKYIVWAEDGQADSLWSDGRMQEQVVQGTIDYFTKTENDPKVAVIPNALIDADISFRLNSVQFEDETKYIHYEWIFEVV
ncbi:MAG: hypothetical protein GX642_08405 [Smithella sp.]|nr:hypothetical protein [Smithella sp.]